MLITFSGEHTEKNPIPAADAFICIDGDSTHPGKYSDLYFFIPFDDLWPSTVEQFGWEKCCKKFDIFKESHFDKILRALKMIRACRAKTLHINCKAGLSRSPAIKILCEIILNYTDPNEQDLDDLIARVQAGEGRIPAAPTFPNIYILQMIREKLLDKN